MAVAPLESVFGARRDARADKHRRALPLLELDPDLGTLLTPGRLAAARAELVVSLVALGRGEWAGARLASASPDHLGLLLVDGAMTCEVLLEDTISTELLGPGDLIRPWAPERGPDLLVPTLRWQVLADARLAVLNRGFAAALLRFPEINTMLLDRICARAERVATLKAISQLNSVERRLVALFWHLAGRWGRVTTDGVHVPLTLSHRLLGEMIGARRPTVSTALGTLEREDRLRRRPDGTWMLLGEPVAARQAPGRAKPHRRRLLATPRATAHRS